MKVTVIPIVTCVLGAIPKDLIKGVEDLEISGDHSNYSIIKIGQNIEKSPGDLRTLTVIQAPVKTHQLKLVWNTPKGVKYGTLT